MWLLDKDFDNGQVNCNTGSTEVLHLKQVF